MRAGTEPCVTAAAMELPDRMFRLLDEGACVIGYLGDRGGNPVYPVRHCRDFTIKIIDGLVRVFKGYRLFPDPVAGFTGRAYVHLHLLFDPLLLS